jgi:hypothetical protein
MHTGWSADRSAQLLNVCFWQILLQKAVEAFSGQ